MKTRVTEPLEIVFAEPGSAALLAEKCNVAAITRSAVQDWIKRKRKSRASVKVFAFRAPYNILSEIARKYEGSEVTVLQRWAETHDVLLKAFKSFEGQKIAINADTVIAENFATIICLDKPNGISRPSTESITNAIAQPLLETFLFALDPEIRNVYNELNKIAYQIEGLHANIAAGDFGWSHIFPVLTIINHLFFESSLGVEGANRLSLSFDLHRILERELGRARGRFERGLTQYKNEVEQLTLENGKLLDALHRSQEFICETSLGNFEVDKGNALPTEPLRKEISDDGMFSEGRPVGQPLERKKTSGVNTELDEGPQQRLSQPGRSGFVEKDLLIAQLERQHDRMFTTLQAVRSEAEALIVKNQQLEGLLKLSIATIGRARQSICEEIEAYLPLPDRTTASSHANQSF